MYKKRSAGILLFRKKLNVIDFFLVHPGGPFWQKKDIGAWSIPKGEFTEDEDALTAAKREFEEETGTKLSGNFIPLTPITQKGGKMVFAWATEGYVNAETIISNTFEIQWPPKSGKVQTFAEVDKAEWFNADEAKQKINPSQAILIDELINILEKNNYALPNFLI